MQPRYRRSVLVDEHYTKRGGERREEGKKKCSLSYDSASVIVFESVFSPLLSLTLKQAIVSNLLVLYFLARKCTTVNEIMSSLPLPSCPCSNQSVIIGCYSFGNSTFTCFQQQIARRYIQSIERSFYIPAVSFVFEK